MKTRHYSRLLIMLVVLAAFSLGCNLLAGQAQAGPIPTSTPVESVESVNSTGEVEADGAAVSGTPMKATLNVQQGLVEVRHSGETTFATITGTELLDNGDMVRTGTDGIATVVFLNNTEVTLFSNTELVINVFESQGANKFLIRLQQFAGKVFARVNFPASGSGFEVTTPYAVAAVRGTGFWIDLDICEAGAAFATVTGEVAINYEDANDLEQTFMLKAEESLNTNGSVNAVCVDDDGEVLGLAYRLFCGDGICDVYTGETTASCPADCNP